MSLDNLSDDHLAVRICQVCDPKGTLQSQISYSLTRRIRLLGPLVANFPQSLPEMLLSESDPAMHWNDHFIHLRGLNNYIVKQYGIVVVHHCCIKCESAVHGHGTMLTHSTLNVLLLWLLFNSCVSE